MQPDTPSAAELTEKEELLFSLHHRDKPTLAFVECKSTAKRDELEAWLPTALPEYEFVTIDLTPLTVGSLLRTLTEKLPTAVRESQPVRYVVNVHGLENRLDETLAAQLNLERELLFRNVPYIILVWADSYFFRRLQRLAPDLWHWVTYKFRFDDPTAQSVEQLPPLPKGRLPQRGNIEVRRERIQDLEERYSHLDLIGSNKLRLLVDKLNIKSILADEYTEAFEFDKAISAYYEALGLTEQLKSVATNAAPLIHHQGMLLFGVGGVYLQLQKFDESLKAYSKSITLTDEAMRDVIYHQIGAVYAAQGKWDLALENYNESIRIRTADSIVEPGDTQHQIGMLYARQKQWAIALESYKNAISIKNELGKNYNVGTTYYQIGRLYEEQQQWRSALKNYHKAIKWDEETGNDFALGNAYHQIGFVHSQQEDTKLALKNYEKALSLYEQKGNTYELAGTYYQIGVLYANQEQFAEAVPWFELAVAHATNHPNLPMAQEALARVRTALGNPPAT